jgi:hypothetical protein
MSARLIFRSTDFDPPVEIARRSLAFAIVCAVLLLSVTHLLAAYAGGWYVIDTARAEAAKIVTAKRANPAVNPPANLIDCTPAGRAEMLRACGARWRMGRVQ